MPYYISRAGEYGADATAEDIKAIRDKAIQGSLVRAENLALRNQAEILFLTPPWDGLFSSILYSAIPGLATQLGVNDPIKWKNVFIRHVTELPETVCDKAVVWVFYPSLAEIEELTRLYSNTVNIVVTEGMDFGELDKWCKDNDVQKIL